MPGRQTSKIKLFYVTKEEIDDVQKDIPKGLLPLPGTKEVHQIFSKSRGQLMFRHLSCFCSRGFCDCLNPKCYSPKTPTSTNISLAVNFSENIPRDDELPLNSMPAKEAVCGTSCDVISFTNLNETRHKSIYKSVYDENTSAEPQPSVSGQNNELPGIGDYLLVKVYGAKGKSYHTYACIAQSNIEDDGDIKVTFLKCVKGGKLFILDEKDVSYVAYDDIIQKLPNPELQRKRGVNYYKFSIDINVLEK